MAMLMLLRRMKVEGATVHGFRSTFRDWASEVVNAPREVAEMSNNVPLFLTSVLISG